VSATKGAGPDLCGDRVEAQKTDVHCGGHESSKPSFQTTQPVRAELSGSDTCTALGITAIGTSPVLKLCRQLLANGLDPDTAVEVYRKGIIALRVRSIAEAAGLEVNSTGTDFVSCRPRAASPVRVSGSPKQIGQAETLPCSAEVTP
jgi:hypothetical protein